MPEICSSPPYYDGYPALESLKISSSRICESICLSARVVYTFLAPFETFCRIFRF